MSSGEMIYVGNELRYFFFTETETGGGGVAPIQVSGNFRWLPTTSRHMAIAQVGRWVMRGSRSVDMGSGPLPPENHKTIGFLSNTGLDPLKNNKATKAAFNVEPSSARQRNTI